ncbi:MAG: hypothetical protein K0B08_03275 [Bacteroidales bacterium]|nr:hypothetical protein [Bacteroidales bacterium]
MKVISRTENSNIATVYIAQNSAGRMVEFVESTQPPLTREDKWVLIVSTLFGCPVECSFCDAGGSYNGRLTAEEILFQIEHPVLQRFPDRNIDTGKFKVQFSRMGEPSFNPAVLEVLKILPEKFRWKSFIPSLSSIAPAGTEKFFEELLKIKQSIYPDSFQLQFSIHSTSPEQRDRWMPVRKWNFEQISAYSKRFYQPGGKKITLNFAVSKESVIDENVLLRHFSPDVFLVKLTPVNPTFKAMQNKIESGISPDVQAEFDLMPALQSAGYEVILSIGEYEENRIGSNCGQFLQTYLNACEKLPEAYCYKLM